MKRLLACLALCASLSAPAQNDTCTVLGIQELSLAYHELNASIDSITQSLMALSDSLAVGFAQVGQRQIVDYDICHTSNTNRSTAMNSIKNCVSSMMSQGWVPYGSGGSVGASGVWQAMVKYNDVE